MTLAISKGITEKLSDIIKEKGWLAALQILTPIDIHFQILSSHEVKNHDVTILFDVKGSASKIVKNPEDLENFLNILLGERLSQVKLSVKKVKYCKEIYTAVIIDRP